MPSFDILFDAIENDSIKPPKKFERAVKGLRAIIPPHNHNVETVKESVKFIWATKYLPCVSKLRIGHLFDFRVVCLVDISGQTVWYIRDKGDDVTTITEITAAHLLNNLHILGDNVGYTEAKGFALNTLCHALTRDVLSAVANYALETPNKIIINAPNNPMTIECNIFDCGVICAPIYGGRYCADNIIFIDNWPKRPHEITKLASKLSAIFTD